MQSRAAAFKRTLRPERRKRRHAKKQLPLRRNFLQNIFEKILEEFNLCMIPSCFLFPGLFLPSPIPFKLSFPLLRGLYFLYHTTTSRVPDQKCPILCFVPDFVCIFKNRTSFVLLLFSFSFILILPDQHVSENSRLRSPGKHRESTSVIRKEDTVCCSTNID